MPKRFLINGKLNVDVAIPYALKKKYPNVEIDLIKSKKCHIKKT